MRNCLGYENWLHREKSHNHSTQNYRRFMYNVLSWRQDKHFASDSFTTVTARNGYRFVNWILKFCRRRTFECGNPRCDAVKIGRQKLSASVCVYNHNLQRTWRQEVLSKRLLIYPTARSHIPDNCTPSVQEFIKKKKIFNLNISQNVHTIMSPKWQQTKLTTSSGSAFVSTNTSWPYIPT